MGDIVTDIELMRRVNLTSGANPAAWGAHNNGSGKLRWFLTREVDGKTEYLWRKDGQLAKFTADGAYRRADDLNRAAGFGPDGEDAPSRTTYIPTSVIGVLQADDDLDDFGLDRPLRRLDPRQQREALAMFVGHSVCARRVEGEGVCLGTVKSVVDIADRSKRRVGVLIEGEPGKFFVLRADHVLSMNTAVIS